jgi:hypothetical protein
MLIFALADALPFATDVAVSVMFGGLGAFAGAVYVMDAPDALDLAESVPHRAPEQPVPESVHVTPLLCGSF